MACLGHIESLFGQRQILLYNGRNIDSHVCKQSVFDFDLTTTRVVKVLYRAATLKDMV